MLAWQLFGAGFDKFGQAGAPSRIPVPACGDEQVLMKVEAIGLCFSDVKLIKAGEQHPRVVVKDLQKEPLTPGHEAVLKVVTVGKKLRDKFKIGQRYIIQAEIYVKGVNLAYGYALQGGMAQYSLMTSEILAGDAGCYLLPIAEHLSAAEAALIEPWTCVIAAYRITRRAAFKPGGLLRVVGDGQPADKRCGALLGARSMPGRIIMQNVAGPLKAELLSLAATHKLPVQETAADGDLADDFILVGRHAKEDVERYASQLAVGGTLCLAGDFAGCVVPVDVGRVHYKAWNYVGTPGKDLAEAYARNQRSTLRHGGVAWFPGGAGAMGQMHVQLALEGAQTPRKVVVTDLDDVRLHKLHERLASKIRAKGVEYVAFNPKTCASQAAVHERLRTEAPNGFDDIVMLVPVPALIGEYARFLAKDGAMNIFAGVPVGSMATLDLGKVAADGQRYIGSSGSSMDDIRDTLKMTETGQLSPVYALGAISGMQALKEGLEGVASARFPGKTVVYPHAVDLPLIAVEDVDTVCAGASKTLTEGNVYTKATEELLRAKWEGDF